MTTLKGRYDPIIPKKTKQSHVVTYSLQRGIKKFQTRGYDAALKEMQQLHERDCWKRHGKSNSYDRVSADNGYN